MKSPGRKSGLWWRGRSTAAILVWLLAIQTAPAAPIENPSEEHPGHPTPGPSHDHGSMAGMEMGESPSPAALLMGLGSGTSLNPASASGHGAMRVGKTWTLMIHGLAFVTDIQQTGPRGEDQIASSNWLMTMATRGIGAGALMLRSMLSLEPATVRRGFYPMLFQTGEEHDGVPIVDGQHPHDFFMELAFAYALPLSTSSSLIFYAAPVGDPALGPVAFPHRVSNAENPTATLGHHLQDSTHIASDVLTAGWDLRRFRVEGSGFHGAEPDDQRWDVDSGRIDSWSARVTFRPTADWAAQISRGSLHSPEAHDPQDITRSTASVIYHRGLENGSVSAGALWGRNRLETDRLTLDSYLLEGNWNFRRRHHLFGRWERVDRNELFADDPAQEAAFESAGIDFFTIRAMTMGYTYDLLATEAWRLGAGADATGYRFPSELDPFYGRRPEAYHLFLRILWHGAGNHGGAAGHHHSP